MDSKISAQAVLVDKEFKVQWFYESKVAINESLYEAWKLRFDVQRSVIDFLSKSRLVTKSEVDIADFIGSPIFCEVEDLREVLRVAVEFLNNRPADVDGDDESLYDMQINKYLAAESTKNRLSQIEEIVVGMRAKKAIASLDEVRGFVHKNPSRVVGLKRERPDLERAIEVFENETEQPSAKSMRVVK